MKKKAVNLLGIKVVMSLVLSIGVVLIGQSMEGLATSTLPALEVVKEDTQEKMPFSPLESKNLRANPDVHTIDKENEFNPEDWTALAMNTPVEFDVERNEANRNYYMYFGTVDTAIASGQGNLSSLNKPVGTIPLTQKSDTAPSLGAFNILTKTAGAGRYMAYTYIEGRSSWTMNYLTLMRTPLNGTGASQVVASTYEGSHAANTFGNFRMQKLYSNKHTPELRAYSYVSDKNGLVVGIMRITQTPVGKTGRVKNDIDFLNLDGTTGNYYTFAYGVHSDLAGNHNSTPTFTLGNLNGLFVGVDGTSTSQITPDRRPYRVYFYRDGYNGQPTQMRPDSHYSSAGVSAFYYWDYNPWATGLALANDKKPGQQINTSTHPVYSFRWEPTPLVSGDRMKIRMDQSVTEESGFSLVPEVTLDKYEGDSTGEEYELSGAWLDRDSSEVDLYYSIDGQPAVKMGRYENSLTGSQSRFTYWIPASELPRGERKIQVYAKDDDNHTSTIKTVILKSIEPPTITLTQKNSLSEGKAFTISGTFKDLDSNTVDLYYAVDNGTAKKIKSYENTPKNTDHPYSHVIPAAELPLGNRKIEVYAIDDQQQKSNVETVLLETPKKVNLTIRYLKEETNQPLVDLTTEQAVPDKLIEGLTIGDDFDSNSYNRSFEGYEFFDIVNDAGNSVPDKDFTISIRYSGFLKLTDVTSAIDFGNNGLLTIGEKDIFPDKPVTATILDTRESLVDWQLSIHLGETFKKNSQTPFKGEVRFKDKNNLDIELTQLKKVVHTRTENKLGTDNVAWDQANQGVYLKQFPGNEQGAYTGKLVWTLTDGL